MGAILLWVIENWAQGDSFLRRLGKGLGSACTYKPRDRLGRFRRLMVRYERLGDIHLAMLDLAYAVICVRRLSHDDGARSRG